MIEAPEAPAATRAECPKCAFPHANDAADCARCGIVFERFEEQGSSERPLATLAEPDSGNLGVEARRALWIGLGLAVVTLLVPFLRFVIGYMTILVHELGHAITGWVFGYPSIPAFDFSYGGGVTSYDRRQILLVGLVVAALGYALYRYRHHRPALVAFGVLTAVYVGLAATDGHRLLMSFMGHGFELIFAGIFLYRAISGSAIKVPAERPLYAFLGFLMVFSGIGFARGLIFDPLARILYEDAKGGGHWMDFSVIAQQHLGVELAAVAWFFLFCCLLTPAAAYASYRYRTTLLVGLGRLLQPESQNAA